MCGISLTTPVEPLRLSHLHKYQIVSLWDMSKLFKAHHFFELASHLETSQAFCIAKESRGAIDAIDSPLIKGDLEGIKKVLEPLGLIYANEQLDRMILGIMLSSLNYQKLAENYRALIHIIQDQLKHELFMHITTSMAKLYKETKPFGQEVIDKLPLVSPDVEEAAKCLAVGRSTACVFHLMRTMEAGIAQLCSNKGIATTQWQGKPWGVMLRAIKPVLDAMPNSTPTEKEEKAKYLEIYAHLSAVKDAWRNPTMHIERSYNEEESLDIYSHVKSFMKSFVAIL